MAALLRLPREELGGLREHQRVGPSGPARLVPDRQLAGIDPAVDVTAAVLGQRPFTGALGGGGEERPEGAAQIAVAAPGQVDRPVVGGARWPAETGFDEADAVRGDGVETRGRTSGSASSDPARTASTRRER